MRTLLPTAKGIRLLGVTVSNFEEPREGISALPLFAAEAASTQLPLTAPAVVRTGGR